MLNVFSSTGLDCMTQPAQFMRMVCILHKTPMTECLRAMIWMLHMRMTLCDMWLLGRKKLVGSRSNEHKAHYIILIVILFLLFLFFQPTVRSALLKCSQTSLFHGIVWSLHNPSIGLLYIPSLIFRVLALFFSQCVIHYLLVTRFYLHFFVILLWLLVLYASGLLVIADS